MIPGSCWVLTGSCLVLFGFGPFLFYKTLLYEGMYGPATYEAYGNKYTSLSEYNEKRFWKLGICLQKLEQQSWRKFLKEYQSDSSFM